MKIDVTLTREEQHMLVSAMEILQANNFNYWDQKTKETYYNLHMKLKIKEMK